MRTSLIVAGIFLMVIGGILYFLPSQAAAATTTTTTAEGTGTWSSYLSVYVPSVITYSSLLVGFALFVIGLIIPDTPVVIERADTDYTEKSDEEYVEKSDDGVRRKTVHKRHVHRS